MAAMHARGDHHCFEPAQIDPEVAVIEDAVDCIDRHRGGDLLGGHAHEKEDRLGCDEADDVLEHVRPGGGQAVELQARVMDLVKAPERVRAVQREVHRIGNEVEDDHRDEQSDQDRKVGDSLGDGIDGELRQLRPEEVGRDGGRGGRDEEPTDIGP
jgi:hypothetical protein